MISYSIINTIIISFLPIFELRGGIPYGLANHLSLPLVFTISVITNILISPFLFWFLNKINPLLLNIKWYNHFYNKYLENARKKTRDKIEKYGYLGLLIFVAIPLPMTGAYTGTLGAWALGMERKRAMLYISLGVIIAGLIVALVAYYGIQALSIFLN